MEKLKILIVEDEFIVANDLRVMLKKAGYNIVGIAASAEQARSLIRQREPDWVLVDIVLQGPETGIDLANELHRQRKPFLFISANTNELTLEMAKAAQPFGFLVKPFRERDLIIMLDIARYRWEVERGTALYKPAPDAILIEGVVGNSPALQQVLEKIRVVAPSDASVLLLGESGTGKERMAQAIHQLSQRREGPFVIVNCGALPLTLLESELFGHEKGAFTGASQRRVGKFEQAHGGTIFLDEVGELPLDAQSKLLRVLQEREIERLGGGSTMKIDVRVIAATNRNLQKEVAERRFRLDLYYRLNVFPVQLPPLRQRKEDLETLVNYFISNSARKHKRSVTGITPRVMEDIKAYDWPGNIRELEHFIERQVLLAGDQIISTADLPEETALTQDTGEAALKTLEQMEREHILKVLKACNGRISGPGGAAEILNIPPTTLHAKIKKLSIKWDFQ